ncbi:class I SAM-dependent methyltransferase [Halobacteriovorax marinus]|nr:class I SAM-dependent methyltransferase [Halobacteriovorax marinus]
MSEREINFKSLEIEIDSAIERAEVTRILHGRGGTYPGLEEVNIDLYPPAIFVSQFKDEDISDLRSFLIVKYSTRNTVIFQERFNRENSLTKFGNDLPNPHSVKEHSAKYLVNLASNQNTGLFLDMREKRAELIENCRGLDILNLFSYTCSLSVAAMLGGANKVVNIDQKKSFLNIGRENHRLNGIEGSVIYKNWDVLKSHNQIGRLGPFDLIICDPPSNQGKSFYYKKDYAKIIKKLGGYLKPEGQFMACLNSPFESTQFLKDLFLSDEREWEFLREEFSAEAFREKDKAQGLKICTFKLL